jgi:2-aminoadipate transaminase
VPTIRALYKSPVPGDAGRAGRATWPARDVKWNAPDGGMFLWVELPEGMDAVTLLPKAVERKGVAFVPGAAVLRR